jgi:hypothetical protein
MMNKIRTTVMSKSNIISVLLLLIISSNALFYLKNNTTGKLTNVFTVQDGTILWM